MYDFKKNGNSSRNFERILYFRHKRFLYLKKKEKERGNHKYRKLTPLVHAYNTSCKEMHAKGSADQRLPQLPGEFGVSLAP